MVDIDEYEIQQSDGFFEKKRKKRKKKKKKIPKINWILNRIKGGHNIFGNIDIFEHSFQIISKPTPTFWFGSVHYIFVISLSQEKGKKKVPVFNFDSMSFSASTEALLESKSRLARSFL